MRSLVLCAALISSALFAQNATDKRPEGVSAPNTSFPLLSLSQSPISLRAQDAAKVQARARAKAEKEAQARAKAEARTQAKAEKEAKGQGGLDNILADKTPKAEKAPSANALPGAAVIPALTFKPYQPSPAAPSQNFEFRTYLEPMQAPFKVSLVGVNINSWLENPDSYSTLAQAAEKFPVEALLDNLAEYSPSLTFNSPSLVKELLAIDIYTPYLKNLPKQPKMPPLFNGRKGVVSFTRNYHIYGAAAAGLPYYGVPAEGADRRIILSSMKDQIREYAVRLPDTDIFLVAMINITPNWLEEGWDVRQVNRQIAEIVVYAFNRKGRLIGAAGLPQNFISKGNFITFSQKLESKIWQPSVPRVFYIWPSFKIVNTPLPGSEKQTPAGELPPSARPYLNKTQKYIVNSLLNIRALGLDQASSLFDEGGRRIYKSKRAPAAAPVFLARRKLYLTNSPVLAKPPLSYSGRALAELDGTAPRYALDSKGYTPQPKAVKEAAEENSKAEKREKARAQAQAAQEAKAKAKTEAKAEKEAKNRAKAEQKAADRVSALQYGGTLSAAPLSLRAQAAEPAKRAQKRIAAEHAPAEQLLAQEELKRENARAEKLTEKDTKERIAVSQGLLRRKYSPGNEKDKIQSLIGDLPSALKGEAFFFTNDMLAISNQIPAYETESDPASYHSERKKYYSVRASAKIYVRQFKKDSAQFKKALAARMDDELYWAALHRKALQDNNLWGPQLEQIFLLYRNGLLLRKKMELERFRYNRDSELAESLASMAVVFGKRELEFIQEKTKKPEKLAAAVDRNQKNVRKALERYTAKFRSEAYLQKKAEFESSYLISSNELGVIYSEYKKAVPANMQVSFLNNTAGDPQQLISQNRAQWTALAELNRVPLEIIAYVEANNFLYPTKRFRLSLEKRALRQYKKNMRFITFEGFMLGLSGGWGSKTYASDRMTGL